MMDRRRDRGLASNAKHLVETRIDLISLRTLVRDVRAAVAARDAGERDQLFSGRETVRHILERCGYAERAHLHRLGDLPFHRSQFVRRGRADWRDR